MVSIPSCLHEMVGAPGFEPRTFRSQSGRATKLRHAPQYRQRRRQYRRHWTTAARIRRLQVLARSRQEDLEIVGRFAIMEPFIGRAAGDRLHVMTYNLRYPADDPGHLWEQRRPAMAALL